MSQDFDNKGYEISVYDATPEDGEKQANALISNEYGTQVIELKNFDEPSAAQYAETFTNLLDTIKRL